MAVYETLNSLAAQTREVRAISSIFKARVKNPDRLEDPTVLVDGDIVVIGSIPDKSIITDIRCILHNQFAGGATLDLGLIERNELGEFVSFASIVDGILLTSPIGSTIVVPIPTDGNINPDGTAYVGINGSIRIEKNSVDLAARINLTSPLGAIEDGRIRVITSYVDVESKTGEYTR